eukprot:m.16704 g.16704  ORF g.16704 m.16704 type:complete len:83 (-) comp5082_c0_seq1:63-311(-)
MGTSLEQLSMKAMRAHVADGQPGVREPRTECTMEMALTCMNCFHLAAAFSGEVVYRSTATRQSRSLAPPAGSHRRRGRLPCL